jgi:hypothetical protein
MPSPAADVYACGVVVVAVASAEKEAQAKSS